MYQAKWTQLFAGLLIATLPVIVVFAILQDRITEGLTVGALKG
jgi:ABC-type glycerol-3-phosphate transport system permease component